MVSILKNRKAQQVKTCWAYLSVSPIGLASLILRAPRWKSTKETSVSPKIKKQALYFELASFQLFVDLFVSPIGFEPMTASLEGRCSIQLSYEPVVFMFLRKQCRGGRINAVNPDRFNHKLKITLISKHLRFL